MRDWLTSHTAPPSAAAPAARPGAACRPATRRSGLPRPPAHVGPQPRLLPVRPCLQQGHVHPGQALHERPGLQPGGPGSYDPHQGVKVRNDLKGAEHQRVALQAPVMKREFSWLLQWRWSCSLKMPGAFLHQVGGGGLGGRLPGHCVEI